MDLVSRDKLIELINSIQFTVDEEALESHDKKEIVNTVIDNVMDEVLDYILSIEAECVDIDDMK